MAGCSSIFIFASLTAPLAERTAFSKIGVSCLHGPHHGAQKSTRTGCRRDSSITSFLKVCVVVSLTRPSAVAAATPTFMQIDLSLPRESQEPQSLTPIKWGATMRLQSQPYGPVLSFPQA